MTVTERDATIRDFVIFQLKLVLDGGKDFVAFWLSIVAICLDVLAGRGRRPRLFYSVVRASERFERWVDLHSVVREVGSGDEPDRVEDGASRDTLMAEVERLVRGGEADRAKAIALLRERSADLRRRVIDPEKPK
jgi:hypothetical protein